MKKAAVLAIAFFGCVILGPAVAQTESQAKTEVPAAVQSVFKSHCVRCHTGSKPPKGLSLIPSRASAIIDAPSAEVPSLRIVDTENPDASYLLKKIRREDGITGKPMPPSKALPAEELQVLEAWILGLK